MSRQKRTAEEWRRAVFRHCAKPSIRLGLIYLADFMDAERKVSRKRDLMAADLGVSERSIDYIIKGAHDAGLLSTVAPGRRHSGPAIYQGLFPSVSANHVVRAKTTSEFAAWLAERDDNGAGQGEETQRAETDSFLRAKNPPLSGASANHVVRTFSNEIQPPACPHHEYGALPCPDDCRYHSPSSNEEEAS